MVVRGGKKFRKCLKSETAELKGRETNGFLFKIYIDIDVYWHTIVCIVVIDPRRIDNSLRNHYVPTSPTSVTRGPFGISQSGHAVRPDGGFFCIKPIVFRGKTPDTYTVAIDFR